MAFSRSETEDRRQWPSAPILPFGSSASCPAPVPPRTWSTTTQTSQTRHWWAQERRGTREGRKRRGRDSGGRHASLSPNLFHPRLLLVQAGTPLPEMHSSASLWVEALATRQSVKTLTDCVDESQTQFFLFVCLFSFFLFFSLLAFTPPIGTTWSNVNRPATGVLATLLCDLHRKFCGSSCAMKVPTVELELKKFLKSFSKCHEMGGS